MSWKHFAISAAVVVLVVVSIIVAAHVVKLSCELPSDAANSARRDLAAKLCW